MTIKSEKEISDNTELPSENEEESGNTVAHVPDKTKLLLEKLVANVSITITFRKAPFPYQHIFGIINK